jgi:type II secretory pathway pseudopilin PulG
MPRRQEGGFSLFEQIVAIALIALVIPPLALLLSGIVRQASVSEAQVTMLNIARGQIESVKRQSYQDLPASYATISPLPDGYSVTTTAGAVKTYTYPAPSATSTLPDEIQLITVEVGCLVCSPPVGTLTLKDYKVRR